MATVTIQSSSSDYRIQTLTNNLANAPAGSVSILSYLNTLVSAIGTKTSELESEIRTKYISDSFVNPGVLRIQTVNYTIDLTGSSSTFGSNESKIVAFNHVTGDQYTFVGTFNYAGLPVVSPILAGSHLTGFSFVTTPSFAGYKSLAGGFSLDAIYTSSGFIGPVKSYGESLFDFNGVQTASYYSLNTSVGNSVNGLTLQDGFLTAASTGITDNSGSNITDSVLIENIHSQLSQTNLSGLYLNLLSGNDVISLKGFGSLQALGGAGNDTFINGPGSTAINGGSGLDTLVESGNRANYTISRTVLNGITIYTVVDKTGLDGTDTLTNVERIKFTDSTVALDIDGTGGQVYRLYQAAFNRAPDPGGLGFHMSTIDNSGLSLTQVARNFISSPEFSNAYGNLSNADFVAQLYANVLHRAPDAGGLKFWTDLLNSNTISQASELVGFSESPENQAALIGVIGNGFSFTPVI